jgi:hypothetical protein
MSETFLHGESISSFPIRPSILPESYSSTATFVNARSWSIYITCVEGPLVERSIQLKARPKIRARASLLRVHDVDLNSLILMSCQEELSRNFSIIL